jgi:hypothetical protein
VPISLVFGNMRMAPGRGFSVLVRLDPGAYHARPAGWRCNRRARAAMLQRLPLP